MAETKTGYRQQRSTKGAKARSNGKAAKAVKKQPARKAKARPARKAKPTGKAKPASNTKPKAGLTDRSKATAHAAGETAKDATGAVKDATGAVGRVAGKAKVPLMAGGAALAGVAGGIAIARQGHRHGGIGHVSSDDLVKAARKAGDVGVQMGEIALEVKRAREATNGNGHRSPIEVVLQGLTSRGHG